MAGTNYDLLIKNGWVVDPANGTSGKGDVAILNGRIERVADNLNENDAAKVFAADGNIVCPGLIDSHTHVADSMMPVSIDPDLTGLPTGVVTLIDAGSTGARTFAGFRKHIISRARTRIRAFLNISSIGLVVTNELYLDAKMLNTKSACRVARENRDLIIGIKARIRGTPDTLNHDKNVMRIAVEVATELDLPIMMHWTNQMSLLDYLRPGDCMTHPFSPAYYGPRCIDENGALTEAAQSLAQRQIVVDLGHGSSFEWQVAETAAGHGFYPDLISTDMFYRYFGANGVVENLPSVMSKFLYLGLSLDQVVEKTTWAAGRALSLGTDVGTLSPGAPADLTVLERKAGSYSLMDSPKLRQTRQVREKLFAIAAVKEGRLFQCGEAFFSARP